MFNKQGNIMNMKQTKKVNKNASLADAQAAQEERALQQRQERMQAISDHRRAQIMGNKWPKKNVLYNRDKKECRRFLTIDAPRSWETSGPRRTCSTTETRKNAGDF